MNLLLSLICTVFILKVHVGWSLSQLSQSAGHILAVAGTTGVSRLGLTICCRVICEGSCSRCVVWLFSCSNGSDSPRGRTLLSWKSLGELDVCVTYSCIVPCQWGWPHIMWDWPSVLSFIMVSYLEVLGFWRIIFCPGRGWEGWSADDGNAFECLVSAAVSWWCQCWWDSSGFSWEGSCMVFPNSNCAGPGSWLSTGMDCRQSKAISGLVCDFFAFFNTLSTAFTWLSMNWLLRAT